MIDEEFSYDSHYDDNKDLNIITHQKWLLNNGKLLNLNMSNEEKEFERLRIENPSLFRSRYLICSN